MRAKGKFISLEGIDGCGKTTLRDQLYDYYKEKYEVLVLREPGGTEVSEKIRDMLLDVRNVGIKPRTEAFLYAASRSQLVEEMILPALQAGKIVIADRFMDSTIAYQGYGRGLDIEFLQELNHLCTGGLKPDLTLLLDIDPEEGQKRRNQDIPDRLEKEGLEFQSRVRAGYLALQRAEPDRIKLLNGGASIIELRGQALQHLAVLL
ncbi:MAG: dTMP kinase [Syntrophomonadaceae bacterium]|nr:dTMP kinase [Syntrophomonadaceae bacterium]